MLRQLRWWGIVVLNHKKTTFQLCVERTLSARNLVDCCLDFRTETLMRDSGTRIKTMTDSMKRPAGRNELIQFVLFDLIESLFD